MLQALETPAHDIDLQTLLHWFDEQGGGLTAARVRLDQGKPVLVATRELAPRELVMKVPRHMVVSSAVARHSPIGLRLQGAGMTDELAYFAAFLADARRRRGHWRAMLDAAPQDFDHLPERFDRADWDLLQGSLVQRLAKERWHRLIKQFRHVNELLPRTQRIALREFAWGWHAAATLCIAVGEGKSATNVLVPLADLLERVAKGNCSHEHGHDGFALRSDTAVAAGTPLTLSLADLPAAQLLAEHGMALEDKPRDTALLSFELGAGHWLHRFAPTMTEGRPSLDFQLGLDTSERRRQLFSFLRLQSLGNERGARAYPALANVDLPWVGVLDTANERAAMQRLAAACEKALAAFTCPVDEDERLLRSGSLAPRQRNAVRVRCGEKRVLLHTLALARDAVDRLAARPAGAPVLVAGSAEQDIPGTTPAERALCEWIRAEGGHVGPIAFRVENGLRGLFATRDIAKGEIVIRVPRHLVLTGAAASHSPLGLRLRGIDSVCSTGLVGACLAAERRRAGPWQAMADTQPASYRELPVLFDRADWDMLQGSEAQVHSRAIWKELLDQFRQIRARLPRHEHISLRDFMWGYFATFTRAFGLSIDGDPVGSVPLADMLNHASDPHCTWSGDHVRSVDIWALRPVSAGTQLTISYGRKSNTKLLSHYGFCVDGNPHDRATLRYALDSPHWLHAAAPEFTDGGTEPTFQIGDDPLSDDARALFSYLRLAELPDEQAARGVAHVPRHRVPMLDPANEAAALRQLASSCEQRLDAFSCGIDEDDALLAAGTLTPNQRNAVSVRRGEKRLLRQTRDMARDAIATLQGSPASTRVSGPWKKYFKDLDALLRQRR